MKLEQVILRGTRASQPAAATVPHGTLYYVTDEQATERSNGTAWEDFTDAGSGGGPPDTHATTHEAAGSDPVTLSQSQITGLIPTLSSKIDSTDPRLSDARTPLAHAVTHDSLGSDPITIAQSQVTGLVTALSGKASTTHATTHSQGGSDPVDVKNLAGYPGGTTSFLRADKTFATIPAPPPVSSVGAIGASFNGLGSTLLAGGTSWVLVPYAHTITAAYMLANAAGSAVIDVWRDTFANYPPTVADSICASAKPTLSSADKSLDTTLTGWSLSGAANTIYKFKLESVSGIDVVALQLIVNKT